jgi:hypothetical protein
LKIIYIGERAAALYGNNVIYDLAWLDNPTPLALLAKGMPRVEPTA